MKKITPLVRYNYKNDKVRKTKKFVSTLLVQIGLRYPLGRLLDRASRPSRITTIKGIVQPFELGGVTRLIRSAVKFCMAGN
jgi:hypothetical protein